MLKIVLQKYKTEKISPPFELEVIDSFEIEQEKIDKCSPGSGRAKLFAREARKRGFWMQSYSSGGADADYAITVWDSPGHYDDFCEKVEQRREQERENK
jgi:hypothetical protein